MGQTNMTPEQLPERSHSNSLKRVVSKLIPGATAAATVISATHGVEASNTDKEARKAKVGGEIICKIW